MLCLGGIRGGDYKTGGLGGAVVSLNYMRWPELGLHQFSESKHLGH